MGRDAARRWAATIAKGLLSGVVLAVLLILLGVPRSAASHGTWPDLVPAFVPLAQVAGLALVVSGLVAWWVMRPAVIGLMAIVAGLAWLAPDLVGARAAADAFRSVALLGAPLLLPSIAVLLVVAATPRPSRSTLTVLAGLFLLALSLSVGRTLTWIPFDDPRCWAFCHPHQNALAIATDRWPGLNRLLTTTWGVLAILGWGGLTAWLMRSLWRRQPIARPVRLMLVAGLTLGSASVIWCAEALLRRTDPPDPTQSGFLVPVWGAQAISLVVLGGGLGWLAAVAIRRAQALRRSLDTLGSVPAPGELRSVLARVLDDPTLSVTYLIEGGICVDADGSTVAMPVAGHARALTTIERGGQPIAIVEHDAALEGPLLVDEIGAAARLAVDNERLRASVLARVADLRASQTRIVAVADDERRRLERDLHDGAQQRLLALSFEIRVALGAARGAGLHMLAEHLERADLLAQSTITELRQLAHGIYPAILRDTGLAPALATLTDDAPLVMELDVRFRGRCAEASEIAAYHVVADALLQATRQGATHLRVGLARVEGMMVVEVDDDVMSVADEGARTADRVGAAGGRLVSEPTVTGPGRRIRAELPCA